MYFVLLWSGCFMLILLLFRPRVAVRASKMSQFPKFFRGLRPWTPLGAAPQAPLPGGLTPDHGLRSWTPWALPPSLPNRITGLPDCDHHFTDRPPTVHQITNRPPTTQPYQNSTLILPVHLCETVTRRTYALTQTAVWSYRSCALRLISSTTC